MTREETKDMLRLLYAAYPPKQELTTQQKINKLDLWSEMFFEDDLNIVKIALKKLINESPYEPKVADVRKKIDETLSAALGNTSDEEMWNVLKKAASNSAWNSKEEFEKLPEELKTYCGSASKLRELSQVDESTMNTVYHGQFLKQFPAIKERVKFSRQLNPVVREMIQKAYKNGGQNQLIPEERKQALIRAVNDDYNDKIDKQLEDAKKDVEKAVIEFKEAIIEGV